MRSIWLIGIVRSYAFGFALCLIVVSFLSSCKNEDFDLHSKYSFSDPKMRLFSVKGPLVSRHEGLAFIRQSRSGDDEIVIEAIQLGAQQSNPLILDLPLDRSAYLAKNIPMQLFSTSFYLANSSRGFEDAECSPCVALDVRDGAIKGIYFVSEYSTNPDVSAISRYSIVEQLALVTVTNSEQFRVVECSATQLSAKTFGIETDSECDDYRYLLLPANLPNVADLLGNSPPMECKDHLYYVIDLISQLAELGEAETLY